MTERSPTQRGRPAHTCCLWRSINASAAGASLPAPRPSLPGQGETHGAGVHGLRRILAGVSAGDMGSEPADVHDGLGKGGRRLLRHIVTDAVQRAVLVSADETVAVRSAVSGG